MTEYVEITITNNAGESTPIADDSLYGLLSQVSRC